MAIKNGLLSSGAGMNKGNGSRSSAIAAFTVVVIIIFFSFLAFSFGRGLFTIDQNDIITDSSRQDLSWRGSLPLQLLKSLFSKEVIDVIHAKTADLGLLSSDFLGKNNLSASWKFFGQEYSADSATSDEPVGIASTTKQDTSKVKQESTSDGNRSAFLETPVKFARRKLREKRRRNHAAELVKQDHVVDVKLENAAMEHSKSVDSAVLGKYSLWRKENENESADATVYLIRDQLIMARVYISLATKKKKLDLVQELQNRLKESQRSLGEATIDSELQHSAPAKIELMSQVLSKAKELLYDCKSVTGKLRAMLQTADEQVRRLKKQSTFLSQSAAKTIPNGLHCLSMRLTIEYYLLPPEKRKFPKSENLENPNLYHYALFSDNVLAASVVVNSTIKNAKERNKVLTYLALYAEFTQTKPKSLSEIAASQCKRFSSLSSVLNYFTSTFSCNKLCMYHLRDPEKHVFHLVTDKLNYGAMNMWFLLNPPGRATINVENVDEFKWLNASYCPVLRQLESAAMKDFYFKAAHPTTLSAVSSNLKYRNPKYLSMLNHLRFYLPQVYPKLNKILFLDDDIVVQKDLTGLWAVDLHGKVNGAVETCGESFHRFDKYLNFSNPHISQNFDPNACGWAYGMNMFDLEKWKEKDITGIYHKWQSMNEDRTLWKLGTLPPGLITFYGLTHPLQKSWHVLGLGYNPSVQRSEIKNAAVIHYNGNMKPWLELAIAKYRLYWTKYINYDHSYIRDCKLK